MTKRDKLLVRLKGRPKDFTWEELVRLLGGFGYVVMNGGKTGGSRIRFVHEVYPPIIMHRPHPKPILKRYQLDGVLCVLEQEGLV